MIENIPTEQAPEKGKRGRKPKVKNALVAMAGALDKMQEASVTLASMSDLERKIFLALTRGLSPLQIAVRIGRPDWFANIRPRVRVYKVRHWQDEDKKHHHESYEDEMSSRDLTMPLIEKLLPEDRVTLDKLVEPIIVNYTKGVDYRAYLTDISDFFKLASPEAYAVIGEIMGDPEVKPETRLKAAQDILDRGGYVPSAQTEERQMPFNLLINMAGTPVAENKAEVVYVDSEDAGGENNGN